MTVVIVAAVLLVASAAGDYCQGAEYYIVPDGRDYRGSVNVTASGIPCQKWSSQVPHAHETKYPDPALGIADNNYCRNPFGDATVGCFTMDPDVAYQECDIGAPCTATPVPSTQGVMFSLPNNTIMPYGSFLCVTCTAACDLYYTTDGSVPSQSSTLYEHCFTLYQSSRVRVVAYFLSGSILIGDQSYGVSMQPTTGSFYPAPGQYTSPVLLFVRINDSIVAADVFLPNVTNPISVGTTGAWLSQSGYAAAVTNNTLVAAGTYEFNIPSPQPPSIFPDAGTFFGGVTCLVYPLPRVNAIYVAFNDSAYQVVSGQTISLTTVGTTVLRLKAMYFDGTTSTASFELTVIDEPTAVCTPPPGHYDVAVNVSCTAPRGDATIQWNGTAREFVILAESGQYNLTIVYSDDTNAQRISSALYVLTPRQLESPVLLPCGGRFAYLSVAVQPSVVTGGVMQLTTADSVRIVNSSGVVQLTAELAGNATVQSIAVPISDPMLSTSNVTTCVYSFYGYGSNSTQLLRAAFVVDQQRLGLCLALTSTAAILSTTLGQYQIISMTNVPTALVDLYNERLFSCLSVQGPTSSSFSAVMSYTLSSTAVTVGASINVTLTGVHLENSIVKMVQDSFTCNDIGILLQPTTGVATFTALTSGTFRLCAVSSGAAYGVPGPLLAVAAQRRVVSVVPCGGSVTQSVSVAVNSASGTLVSVNGGQWSSVATIVVRASQLPLVLSAVNGDATEHCTFYAPTSVPSNLTYQLTLLNSSGVDVTVVGVVGIGGAMSLSVQSARCNINTTGGIRGTQIGDTIVLDELVTGNLPPNPVVCLSNGEWVVEVLAANIPLTSDLLLLRSCPLCSSGYCFSNDTCACGRTSFTVCDTTKPVDDDEGGAPVWVRVVMVFLLFGAIVAAWIVFGDKPLK